MKTFQAEFEARSVSDEKVHFSRIISVDVFLPSFRARYARKLIPLHFYRLFSYVKKVSQSIFTNVKLL